MTMDSKPTYSLSVYTLLSVCSVLLMCVMPTQCVYKNSTLVLSNVHRTSKVTATNSCEGTPACKDKITGEMCNSDKICRLQCPAGRRTDFPTVKVLTGSTCPATSPPTPPPNAGSNGYFFVSDTENCSKTISVNGAASSGNFALSFWLQGSCTTSCALVRIKTPPVLTVTLLNEKLSVNGNSITNGPSVTSSNWTHVTIVKRNGNQLELYMDNVKQTLDSTLTDTLTGVDLLLGPSAALGSGDNYTIYDGRFYPDGLTNREIKSVFSGSDIATDDKTACRCPLTHPAISSDNSNCENGSSGSVERVPIKFYTAQNLVDVNSDAVWASGESGDVVITLDLGRSFMINKVSLSFMPSGGEPLAGVWKFKAGEVIKTVDPTFYTCSITGCTYRSSKTVTTYPDYLKTIAEKIEVTFTGRTAGISGKSLHITNVDVSGGCDCDGSADGCSSISGPQVYKCTCKQRTEGESCKDCINPYYREENGFGCMTSCPGCFAPGVEESRTCEQVGGKCNCKSNVTGQTCNTCKRLTYRLEEDNPDGCKGCNCDQDGSESCDKDSGECLCRPNVTRTDCSTCMPMHYGIQSGKGCLPCMCNPDGTLNSQNNCNLTTGECPCKTNVQGERCSECKDRFHSLTQDKADGCSWCGCDMLGTNSTICNKTDGQCLCRGNDFTNKHCKPVVDDPIPDFGPIAGDTTVTINGHYLGDPVIKIDNISQIILNVSDTMIKFRTRNRSNTGESKLTVEWESRKEKKTFSYRVDPVVTGEGLAARYRASRSGGCIVEFSGTNLDSVYKPRMSTTIDGAADSLLTDCTHAESGSRIRCSTPVLDDTENSRNLSVGLVMDGVRVSGLTSLNITKGATVTSLGRVDFTPPFDKTLKITGSNLGLDCERAVYQVYIGGVDYQCRFVTFTSTEIVCEPPTDSPDIAENTNQVYAIKLRIGTRDIEVGEIYYRPLHLSMYFIYIMLGVAAFVLIVLAILIVCCVRRCRRRRSRENINKNSFQNTKMTQNGKKKGKSIKDTTLIEQPKKDVLPMDNPIGPTVDEPDGEEVVNTEYFLHRVEESIRSNVQTVIIGEKNFTCGNIVNASGNYCCLLDGKFTSRSKIQPNQKITIKMVKDSLPESGVLPLVYMAALRECVRLRNYNNVFVLSIHGIGLDKKRFYIIYPHMEKKTLKMHVADQTKYFVLRELLDYSVQVAKGMDFLSKKDFVHKDLAARNCMVDSKGQVKISDAAFSWDFCPEEYMYDKQRDRYLPVRWMAPESLSSGFYDSKSDVWGFGVLMWELLTRGILPFHEIRDEELQSYVMDGYRLGKPQTVSDEQYELMNSCWHIDSDHRPTFGRIQQQISTSLTNRQSMNEDLYINLGDVENIYVNLDDLTASVKKSRKPPRIPPRT